MDEKYLPELMAEKDSLDPSFTHALRLVNQGEGRRGGAGRLVPRWGRAGESGDAEPELHPLRGLLCSAPGQVLGEGLALACTAWRGLLWSGCRVLLCWGCRCSPPAGAFPCPARWAPSALPLSHRRFPAIALGSAYPHSEMCACVTRLALLCSARAAPQLKPQNVFLFYPVSEQ